MQDRGTGAMNERARRIGILVAFALLGWVACFATIGIAMHVTSEKTALIVTPLQTALAFTAMVVFLDFFLVALVVLRSLDMFASVLGTWIPFGLIFTSTWLTGLVVRRQSPRPRAA